MADDEYQFGEAAVRDGSINDPGMSTYNIYELAEKQADYMQNRQVREREERERLTAARLAEVEKIADEPQAVTDAE